MSGVPLAPGVVWTYKVLTAFRLLSWTPLRLQLLLDWKAKGFDCGTIRMVLAYVQRQLSAFEGRIGDLSLAAAGLQWLAIQKAVQDLLQPCSSQQSASDTKQKKRRHMLPHNTAKPAALRALSFLGGSGTHKQVRAYLRRHPEMLQGADAANLERILKSIRF